MDVILIEAKESYEEDIVVELKSESVEEMEENISRIEQWVENYRQNNGFEEINT